jgi:hypothetical protein
VDGRTYECKPDGTLVPIKGKSDWSRVDVMTDEELTTNASERSGCAADTTRNGPRPNSLSLAKVLVGSSSAPTYSLSARLDAK